MYIDYLGKAVISHRYSLSTRFAKGLAHVRIKKGTFGYINRYGKLIFKYRDFDPAE